MTAGSYLDTLTAGHPAGDGPIEAAVTPWATLDLPTRIDRARDLDWQTKFRRYDRQGPGIVGAAADLPAATSTLLELCVQRRQVKGWETIEDPRFAALLAVFRGRWDDPIILFSKILRTLDGPGEGYLVLRRDPELGWYWQLAQTTNLTQTRHGEVAIRTRRTPEQIARPDRWTTVVPPEHVHHFHLPDNEFEDEAWSPMLRGLEDIDRYRQAMRNVGRNLDSQLAMNGILWAKAVAGGTGWIDAIAKWAGNAITDDETIESVVPFSMATEERPEWIDIGRGQHTEQLAVADASILGFARSTDLPTQMLVEGPASGNHWNAYLEGDFYADMTMRPRWVRGCSIVTNVHLRPWMRQLRVFDGDRPEDYRVWCDDTRIRTKTDNTDRVIKARELGIASRDAVAESIGLRGDQILDLPEGITDWESWVAGRVPAAVGADEKDGAGVFIGDRIGPDGSGMRVSDPGEPVRAELDQGGPSDREAGSWNDLTPA